MVSELKTAFLAAYPNADSRDYDRMVQDEAKNEMQERKMRETAANITAAEKTAQEWIAVWAREAMEFHIKSVADFIVGRRKACAWAVLIGQEAAGKRFTMPAS